MKRSQFGSLSEAKPSPRPFHPQTKRNHITISVRDSIKVLKNSLIYSLKPVLIETKNERVLQPWADKNIPTDHWSANLADQWEIETLQPQSQGEPKSFNANAPSPIQIGWMNKLCINWRIHAGIMIRKATSDCLSRTNLIVTRRVTIKSAQLKQSEDWKTTRIPLNLTRCE